MELMNTISATLQAGRAKEVKALVQQAIDEGVSASVILNEGLLSGMDVIGVKFKNNEIYVPDVLIAARAMKTGTALLKPLLIADGVAATGKAVIGTVSGDLHDIGKNLVAMMMEGKGIEMVDLGTDVTAEQFVSAAIESEAQFICCSALLTTTMSEMKKVVELATEKGVRDKITIMVGGAPVNESFCEQIGADIYSPDAASAADAAMGVLAG